MTAPRALALSDMQLALLQRAAASLPVGERDHFLRSMYKNIEAAAIGRDEAKSALCVEEYDPSTRHAHVIRPIAQ